MKPKYDGFIGKWHVKGIGWFDNPADAWRAIKDIELKTPLMVKISKEMKAQLERESKKRGMTVSEIVRTAIRKEVNL